MPSAAPWPVVPIIVTAESCVAMTERPTAHHGRLAIGEQIAVDCLGSLRSAQAVDDDLAEVADDDDPVERAHLSRDSG